MLSTCIISVITFPNFVSRLNYNNSNCNLLLATGDANLIKKVWKRLRLTISFFIKKLNLILGCNRKWGRS